VEPSSEPNVCGKVKNPEPNDRSLGFLRSTKQEVSYMKRAVFYTRVSSVDQHPETQLCDLRPLAAARGYEIVGEYSE
jgi:hypothetical protein